MSAGLLVWQLSAAPGGAVQVAGELLLLLLLWLTRCKARAVERPAMPAPATTTGSNSHFVAATGCRR